MGGESPAADYEINQHNHEHRPPIGEAPAAKNFLDRWDDRFFNFIDKPVTWFRGGYGCGRSINASISRKYFFITSEFVFNLCLYVEKIVEPNRKNYPWYHQDFPRVPTIDQCFTDDVTCIYEANQQFHRDRMVDSEIVKILRYRMDDCFREEYPDYQKCLPFKEVYEEASANWFSKCKEGYSIG
jgi:hypothetical protein